MRVLQDRPVAEKIGRRIEAEFLVWERSTKVQVYKKTVKKVSPDIKACQ